MKDLFSILHAVKDGKHYLTITPQYRTEGYPAKTVEVTEVFWNELKFHFAVGYDDKNNIQKLAYVI